MSKSEMLAHMEKMVALSLLTAPATFVADKPKMVNMDDFMKSCDILSHALLLRWT